jgi:hypothetical protein
MPIRDATEADLPVIPAITNQAIRTLERGRFDGLFGADRQRLPDIHPAAAYRFDRQTDPARTGGSEHRP